VLGGGKHVRPLLVYAAGEVTAADCEALDRAALAWSTCMPIRWCTTICPAWTTTSFAEGSRPCTWHSTKRPDAGRDALQAEAFKVLADGALPASQTASLMRELAHAAGTQGMCGGQGDRPRGRWPDPGVVRA